MSSGALIELKGLIAIGGLALCTACGGESGNPAPTEPEAPPVETDGVPERRNEPEIKVMHEEPGVVMGKTSARFTGHIATGDTPAAEGDEYATHGSMAIKGEFRPDLVVGTDVLRNRAQVEGWK